MPAFKKKGEEALQRRMNRDKGGDALKYSYVFQARRKKGINVKGINIVLSCEEVSRTKHKGPLYLAGVV